MRLSHLQKHRPTRPISALVNSVFRRETRFIGFAGGGRALKPYGIGSAVVDLIFSMANRDVTFFNGTAAINFL
jgi:hypothetical protein